MSSSRRRSGSSAGRSPEDVARIVNVMALDGPPNGWVDQLARINEDLGFFSKILVAAPSDDPLAFVRRLGEDVAPALRARVG